MENLPEMSDVETIGIDSPDNYWFFLFLPQ